MLLDNSQHIHAFTYVRLANGQGNPGNQGKYSKFCSTGNVRELCLKPIKVREIALNPEKDIKFRLNP